MGGELCSKLLELVNLRKDWFYENIQTADFFCLSCKVLCGFSTHLY